MEVKGEGLRDAIGIVAVGVVAGALENHNVLHATIDLVGGRIEDDGLTFREASSLQNVEGAQSVDLKVVAGILDRKRDSDLGGKVVNDIDVGRSLAQCLKVTDVGLKQGPSVTMLSTQPFDVVVDPGTREIVVDDDLVALADQPVCEIATNKACSAGYKCFQLVSPYLSHVVGACSADLSRWLTDWNSSFALRTT
jgi:hypothetical protein